MYVAIIKWKELMSCSTDCCDEKVWGNLEAYARNKISQKPAIIYATSFISYTVIQEQ